MHEVTNNCGKLTESDDTECGTEGLGTGMRRTPKMYVLRSVMQFGKACCRTFDASLVVMTSKPNLS